MDISVKHAAAVSVKVDCYGVVAWRHGNSWFTERMALFTPEQLLDAESTLAGWNEVDEGGD